ncbi:MAG: shikimate dehydrogenase family protein [Phycisphaerales bacterium]
MTVCNRTPERAERLRDELREKLADAPGSIEVAEWDGRHGLEARAWINGTSIGMSGGGADGESPLDFERMETPHDAVVLDTVYAPRRTPLLARAEERGLRTIDGVSVFVRQAIAQSVLWTGDSESLSGLHALFTRVSEEVLASET